MQISSYSFLDSLLLHTLHNPVSCGADDLLGNTHDAANANIQTKGDILNYRMVSPSCNLSFVVQKCWLKHDALCLRVSINDVLQRSVQDVALDCGFFYTVQKTRSRSHRLDISIRYTFNAQKSKYKGTGAGKAEQERMSNNN